MGGNDIRVIVTSRHLEPQNLTGEATRITELNNPKHKTCPSIQPCIGKPYGFNLS